MSSHKIMVRIHKFTDCATQSGGEMTSFGAKNGQCSRIFTQTNEHELTTRQRCKNEVKKCDKRFIKTFSNLSDSQFIENDRLDPILSFSIN